MGMKPYPEWPPCRGTGDEHDWEDVAPCWLRCRACGGEVRQAEVKYNWSASVVDSYDRIVATIGRVLRDG